MYVYDTAEALDLLDRADALRCTDLFITRSELDRLSFMRMYSEVDAYVTAEENLGIDEALLDDFDSLLTEWETLLLTDSEDTVEVYA